MSATRYRLKNHQIINAQSMTGTSVITSDEIDVLNVEQACVQFIWTGTPNGTFILEGCVSVDANTNAGNAWSTLVTTPASITATGAAGNHIVDCSQIGFNKLRAKYTNSSSTGTLNAYITTKGV